MKARDDWDHFEELDEACTWFLGSCHRKRIARWHIGKGREDPPGQRCPLLPGPRGLPALCALFGRVELNRSWPDIISATPRLR
jgi:hypothetical protein